MRSEVIANNVKMPVLFLGHGSPMNAIEENEFTWGFRTVGQTLPRPSSILVISAHWETRGTHVTAMEKPRTIHDFGGFPPALFAVQYPAPGNPQLASDITRQVTESNPDYPVTGDLSWGLDHGAWSVVKHLYPEADVPVVQISLNYLMKPSEHYAFARQLAYLRNKGVLIIGSGNIVHNLGMVAWNKLHQPGYAFDWAMEAREKINHFILDGNHSALIDYTSQGSAFKMAIPSPDHYLPLLYALALQEENERVELFNDKAVGGSLTMTSLVIGSNS